jgi:poly(3-hydroxybutyrate) depolymerase
MSSEANSGDKRSGFRLRALLLLVLIGAAGVPAASQKAVSRTLSFGGHERAYQLMIPAQATAGPVPLIVLLHGRGGNGQRPMAAWQGLARDQGIALVAPNSLAEGWAILQGDGPDFFQALIETVKKDATIDGRRVYLFGHSSGGHQALALGPLESEYFAAIAVHAGALNSSERVFLREARRKIPVGMWHGSADDLVPLQMGRDTRDMFKSLEFPVTLNEIASHTHDYFSRSARINQEVWAFLKGHALTADPVYRPYTFRR